MKKPRSKLKRKVKNKKTSSFVSCIEKVDKKQESRIALFDLPDVTIKKRAALGVDEGFFLCDEAIFMLNYYDGSPEVLQAKDCIDAKPTGQYGIACADGTYLIIVEEDRMTMQFRGGIVIDPTPHYPFPQDSDESN